MLIAVVGLNHRTAPVEVREKLSFAGSHLKALLRLKEYPVIEGCAILSTCNRTEIYAATMEMDEGMNAIWDFLSRWSKVDISQIKNYTYCHTLYDTIRHIFRVAAGLDSMLLGETQILGQVRSAYQEAVEYESTNRVLKHRSSRRLRWGSVCARNGHRPEPGIRELRCRGVGQELSGRSGKTVRTHYRSRQNE